MDSASVLYDAGCGFCRWALDLVLAWDRGGRLRPVALDSADADRLLGDLDEETRMGSWHIVTADGRRESGGRALGPLLRLLPGGPPLAALVERFPQAADRAYFAVADRRAALSRLVSAIA